MEFVWISLRTYSSWLWATDSDLELIATAAIFRVFLSRAPTTGTYIPLRPGPGTFYTHPAVHFVIA